MGDAAPLTIAFIEKRPLSAARTLAAMEPDDAAAFLETIPARFAANAFSHMGAWPASALLAKMGAASGGAALRELDYPNATAILRLMSEDRRAQLLTELPEKLQRDFETSLSFPEDTVGAQMTTAIVAMARDHTIADAITQIRQSRKPKTDVVFVIDKARKLAGAASPAALLCYPSKTKLGDIMDANVVSLSARARLSAVSALEAWDDYTQLAVVSRQKQVIGALSRKTAQRGADHYALTDAENPTSIAASIASAFFMSGIGLAQLLGDVDPLPHSSKREGEQL